MAFDCQEIKGLLTYLLTYYQHHRHCVVILQAHMLFVVVYLAIGRIPWC